MSTNDSILAILLCAVIVLVITGLQYQYASTRRGKASTTKPSKIMSFNSMLSIEKSMKVIIQFAQSNGYMVDYFDEKKSTIILSDSTSMGGIAFGNSGGFIYPIYLSIQSNNVILIEVGIKHKMFRLGDPATGQLAKCCNGIKASIFATPP
jgi:hypothetical protein